MDCCATPRPVDAGFRRLPERWNSWRNRHDAAGRQIEVFRSRQEAAEAEHRRLSVLPGEIAGKRQALLNEIDAVEQRRRIAADRLAAAETRLADADRTVKAAEGALLEARENRVRAEGTVEQAEQANNDVAERIAERLDVAPAQLADVAGIKADDALPELEAEERRLERLRREREVMGPVNLRAEQEFNGTHRTDAESRRPAPRPDRSHW